MTQKPQKCRIADISAKIQMRSRVLPLQVFLKTEGGVYPVSKFLSLFKILKYGFCYKLLVYS